MKDFLDTWFVAGAAPVRAIVIIMAVVFVVVMIVPIVVMVMMLVMMVIIVMVTFFSVLVRRVRRLRGTARIALARFDALMPFSLLASLRILLSSGRWQRRWRVLTEGA